MNLAVKTDAVESLASTIGTLAAYLGGEIVPAGDRAALKRMSPDAPPPLAYYRLWLLSLGEDPRDPQEAWTSIVWGLAMMGKNAHDPKRGFGKALAEAKFSEARLEQMLGAPEDIRNDLFRRALRFLAANGRGFNWMDAALFLLTRDDEKREQLHRKIATDFYRNLPKDQ